LPAPNGVARSFALADLAPLGIIPKLAVVEKQLLARGKDKVLPAVNTLQNLINELHKGFRFRARGNLGIASDVPSSHLDLLHGPSRRSGGEAERAGVFVHLP
jgi:hypothetical protein